MLVFIECELISVKAISSQFFADEHQFLLCCPCVRAHRPCWAKVDGCQTSPERLRTEKAPQLTRFEPMSTCDFNSNILLPITTRPRSPSYNQLSISKNLYKNFP